MLLFELLLLLALGALQSQAEAGCSALDRNGAGATDITQTLYNCSRSMSDPEMIYSYKEDVADPIVLFAELQLHSLVSLQDTDTTGVLDLLFTLSWVDPRWNLTALWPTRSSAAQEQGIVLDQLVFRTDKGRLRMWLPDVDFTEKISWFLIDQSLKLMPEGLMIWKRRVKMSVVQAHFSYKRYPLDEHEFILRFGSLAYSTDFLRMRFTDASVSFVSGAYPNTDDVNWELNHQWLLNSGDFSTHVHSTVNNVTIPGNMLFPYDAASTGASVSAVFDYASIQLAAQRINQGILIRLGFPILALTILSGLMFWVAYEMRIEATMTILYAVSALYIVVFSNIPMLGYITDFDTYILAMFIVLTSSVVVHQLTHRLLKKAPRRPLRFIITRFLELVGRMTVIPLSTLLFMDMFFNTPSMRPVRIGLTALMLCVWVFVFLRDSAGLRKHVLLVFGYYEERLSRGDAQSMSEFELKSYVFYQRYLRVSCGACGRLKKNRKKLWDEIDDNDSEEEEYNSANVIPDRDDSHFGAGARPSGYGVTFFDMVRASASVVGETDTTGESLKRPSLKRFSKKALVQHRKEGLIAEIKRASLNSSSTGIDKSLESSQPTIDASETFPADSRLKEPVDLQISCAIDSTNDHISPSNRESKDGHPETEKSSQSDHLLSVTSAGEASLQRYMKRQQLRPVSGRIPGAGKGRGRDGNTSHPAISFHRSTSHLAPTSGTPSGEPAAGFDGQEVDPPQDVVVYFNPLLRRGPPKGTMSMRNIATSSTESTPGVVTDLINIDEQLHAAPESANAHSEDTFQDNYFNSSAEDASPT